MTEAPRGNVLEDGVDDFDILNEQRKETDTEQQQKAEEKPAHEPGANGSARRSTHRGQ